jgi:hypothetical protein
MSTEMVEVRRDSRTHLLVDLETLALELLSHLLGLVKLNLLDLLLDPLELPLLDLLLLPLLVLLSLLRQSNRTSVLLLLLLPRALLVVELLAALDDLRTSEDGVALVRDLGLEVREGGLASGEGDGGGSVLRGGNLVQGRMEGGGEAGEVGAEEGRSGRLEGLDRVVAG